jgi:hypothetical protein
MAAVRSTSSTDIEDIQRRMAQIRHEMHEDVRGAVQGAQSLTDWRSLVKSRPWLSVGLAAAAGYMLVPRRPPVPPIMTVTGVTLPPALGTVDAGPRPRTGSTFSFVLGLFAPVILRAAQGYAAHHLEAWLSSHPLPLVGIGHERQPDDGSSRPAGPTLPFQRVRGPA